MDKFSREDVLKLTSAEIFDDFIYLFKAYQNFSMKMAGIQRLFATRYISYILKIGNEFHH